MDPTLPPYTDEEITALKPAAPPELLAHKDLVRGEFWRKLPAYRDVEESTFLDHAWQTRQSITSPEKLMATIKDLVSPEFLEDARQGFARAPMAVRVSPYMMACIDWDDPYHDPIRTQFIPLGSRLLADHPMLRLDSLGEQADAPVPGLTHRYTDKALFLPLNVCPVYCRYCTRAYAVGLDTESVDKVQLTVDPRRWAKAFKYVASRPELEDIVISGGDAYQLSPRNLLQIGETLLKMDNIRRIRVATKGPAVMPMKILTHGEWTDALTRIVDLGRTLGKEVALHTHFGHPNEITEITERAVRILSGRGIVVRNQSVLIRGVNDNPETMRLLVKRLGHLNIHPYYVYMHDMTKGVEDLRTRVQTAIDIEKYVRGSTAGFNTPTFVCDAPGGGGKRDVHSFEYYDRENGIAVYVAPSVKPGQMFLYFDPIDTLAPEAQARWGDTRISEELIRDAKQRAMDAAR
ncbi:MAG: KamA family radical SAM protein [Candidatus Sericytochromatia bacterium]|nr:KamA family radical SAM protein [Candidatus Tanganyikabacteria bacterium]